MNRDFTYYNDYIRITKQYLKNLNTFRVALYNMRTSEKKLKEELEGYNDIPSPVVAYREKITKAPSSLTGIEAVIEKRLKKEKSLTKVKRDITELESLITKLDNAIDGLTKEDREILTELVINAGNADDVAYANHISRRTLFYRNNMIIQKVSFMIFGPKAVPDNRAFVFAE